MKKLKMIITISVVIVIGLMATSCGNDNPYSGVDFDKYIKVSKYKGLPKAKQDISVKDAEVTQYIEQKLAESGETKTFKQGTVKKGDTANIDYVGRINGKKFENGSADGYDLVIGSNQFIKGFETQLIGKKAGKTVKVNVTFPKNYGTEKLAGKPAEFTVRINHIKKLETPTLNDEFVKKVSKKSKNVKEYKAEVKTLLTKQKKDSDAERQKEIMMNQVVGTSTINTDKKGEELYPEEQLKAMEKEITDFYTEQAKESNLKLKEYVKQTFNMDMKVFKEQVKQLAKSEVRQQLVIYYIAEKEKIKVSEDDYNAYIKKLYKMYGMNEEQFKEANKGKTLEELRGKEALMRMVYRENVKNWIYKNAK